MTVTAADVDTPLEAVLDRTAWLKARCYDNRPHAHLLPRYAWQTEAGPIAAFNGGILVNNDFRDPQLGLILATLGNSDSLHVSVCASTIMSLYSSGGAEATTDAYFYCDFYGAALETEVDQVEIDGDYGYHADVDDTLVAVSALAGDGDDPEHESASIWIAENWEQSGWEGNLHLLTFNGSTPPAWSKSAKTSPFGGIGSPDLRWTESPNGAMTYHVIGVTGYLVAWGRYLAANPWFVNVSTDSGVTWGGLSASSVSTSAAILLLEYSTELAAWVLVDSNGHVWLCTTADPSSASNWVKGDSEAAGDSALEHIAAGDFTSAALVGRTLVLTCGNGLTNYVVFVDAGTSGIFDYSDYRVVPGVIWTSVKKHGDYLVYSGVDGGNTYTGVTAPLLGLSNVTDVVTP